MSEARTHGTVAQQPTPHWALGVTWQRGDFTLRAHAEWRGRVTALCGPSGSGKSTLLELIAGLPRDAAAEGSIRFEHRTLFDANNGINLDPADRGLAWVPQDLLLLPHLDVDANLRFGRRHPASVNRAGQQAMPLADILQLLDLSALRRRLPNTLSGGERQRVAIGRALASGAQLLLLDEPFAALDSSRRNSLCNHLLTIRDTLGVSMVVVSHQHEVLDHLCDAAVYLDAGCLRTL